jgi:hypothetical protein
MPQVSHLLNAPHTVEGSEAWDLLCRSGNQLRLCGRSVIGLDLGAAIALGEALGLSPLATAEILTDAEPVVVAVLNRAIKQS